LGPLACKEICLAFSFAIFWQQLQLHNKGKDLPLLLGRRGTFSHKFPYFKLHERVGNEVVGLVILPFLLQVLLASQEVKELDVICSFLSLEEVYQEVAGAHFPSQKVLDLGALT
jgi:hypothetical protein